MSTKARIEPPTTMGRGKEPSAGCGIDVIYVAASTLDARLTRICVASVRRIYPDLPVRILAGGCLQPGLASELRHYFDVELADISHGDYGWGFVKLEPLFGLTRERFLMLDSDTVLTGPVTDLWHDSDAPFVVDDEHYEPDTIPERYYDWSKVHLIDEDAMPPRFVFNSGQWVGTSGILDRADFDPWIEWTFPRVLRHPDLFFPGDQGVLNYVLVQKAMRQGLQVEPRPIMRWPGYGLDFDAQSIADGNAPLTIIHWAGVKKRRHRDMVGADILAYFERLYYGRLPGRQIRRVAALGSSISAEFIHEAKRHARNGWAKFMTRERPIG